MIYRDALQKFFYPFDYQEIPTTKPLVPGQKRVHTGLDVKFSFECDTTLDILFSKNRVCVTVILNGSLEYCAVACSSYIYQLNEVCKYSSLCSRCYYGDYTV